MEVKLVGTIYTARVDPRNGNWLIEFPPQVFHYTYEARARIVMELNQQVKVVNPTFTAREGWIRSISFEPIK